MSLEDWASNGWLSPHQPTPGEIADLLALADRDLRDCRTEGLSADWKFNIAYNALLQSATAALAAARYRAARESHHYRVLQSLGLTVGVSGDVLGHLDAFRKKRNLTGYQRAGAVSDQEVCEMIDLAEVICQQVRDWIAANHSDLL